MKDVKKSTGNSKVTKPLIPVMNPGICKTCKKKLKNKFDIISLSVNSSSEIAYNYCFECGKDDLKSLITKRNTEDIKDMFETLNENPNYRESFDPEFLKFTTFRPAIFNSKKKL